MKKGKTKKTKASAPKKYAEAPIAPLGDRVLILPDTEISGKETPGGIFIPETVDREKPQRGKVIAVGPGKRGDDNEIIPVGVKIGQRVIFSKYGYDEVKIDGTEYYLVSESSILAVLE